MIEVIQTYKKNDNFDQIDITCDILDSSIICLSYLLKSYSRELEKELNDPQQPLSSFVEELINFNIEGQMTYVSLEENNVGEGNYGDEGEADDYDYYEPEGDSDEKGWKVRRATMHYITVLLKKDKNFKKKISTSEELINELSAKLIESNTMVSEMAFQTFHNLIENISTEKNVSFED